MPSKDFTYFKGVMAMLGAHQRVVPGFDANHSAPKCSEWWTLTQISPQQCGGANLGAFWVDHGGWGYPQLAHGSYGNPAAVGIALICWLFRLRNNWITSGRQIWGKLDHTNYGSSASWINLFSTISHEYGTGLNGDAKKWGKTHMMQRTPPQMSSGSVFCCNQATFDKKPLI